MSPALTTEEFMVPALDPGIEIYVRNKRPADMTAFRPERTVLFVHGATYPAHTTFDLQLDGLSWMDYIAARGYDVYLLDLRGYGKSTRPKEMAQRPDANPPIVRTETAVKDISAVVDFILKRRNIPRLVLLGWSWGTFSTPTYTTQHPDKVERLVLYAPIWIGQTGRLAADRIRAARRLSHRHARSRRRARWYNGVPEDKKAALISAGVFDAWADATWATDPEGAKHESAGHPRAQRRDGRTSPKPGGPARPTTIRRRSRCRRCWSRPPGTPTCRRAWRATLLPLLVNSPEQAPGRTRRKARTA